MNGRDSRTPEDNRRHIGAERAGAADVLISRMIDGEASAADRERFEASADGNPVLWRDLALHLIDARQLEQEFDAAVAPAVAVELPRAGVARGSGPVWRTLAGLGWAAALILAVAWAALPRDRGLVGSDARPALSPVEALTPGEHLQRYLATSPLVIEELPPTLLQVTPLPEGGKQVNYLRRIEESGYLEPGEELSVNELGHLLSPLPTRGGAPGSSTLNPG